MSSTRQFKTIMFSALCAAIFACGPSMEEGSSQKGGSPDNDTTPSDTTAPIIISIDPATGATDVALDSTITATFSENMNASTIDETTFTVSGVTGAVSYDSDTRTATFTPSSALDYGTTYMATITTGVQDLAGNALDSDYTWSFTTGVEPDTAPPTVNSTSPANDATDVAVNSSISVTFSETMDASTITTDTFTVSSGGVDIAGTVAYTGTTAIFTPSTSLDPATTYTVTITTSVKDEAGNQIPTEYAWSFTTTDAACAELGSGIWTTQTSGTASYLENIARSGDMFVAVGRNGTILTSVDGESWSVQTSGTTKDINGVTWFSDISKFIAVGSGPTILTSSDGSSWDSQTINASSSIWTLSDVDCSASQCVAVGIWGALFVSTDGENWTQKAMGITEEISNVIWSGSKWVAIGGSNGTVCFTSSDGDSWNACSIPYGGMLFGLAWSGNTFVTTGWGGSLFTSPNGETWTSVESGTSNGLWGVTWTGNEFVAVGSNGTIITSVDATNWTLHDSGIDDVLSGVGYSDTKIVVVGQAILTSSRVCGGQADTTPSDTTAPIIISANPATGATDVALDSTITATFSENMNASTIDEITFTVSGVTGAVSYDSDTRTATFTPSSALDYGTTYTATITTGVKDLAGNNMASDYSWSFTTRPQGSWATFAVYTTDNAGTYPAIAIDSDDNVHISFHNETDHDLMYATDMSGEWIVEMVDDQVWAASSIAIDQGGNVHMSYYDSNSLKYATNASGGWATEVIDSQGGGSWSETSIVVDSNGYLHISYYDKTNKVLKYATNVSGFWVTETVDSQDGVGQYNSLAVDTTGNAHISYWDWGNYALKYASNSTGQWVTEIIDSEAWVYSSIALDSSGNAHVAYQRSYDLWYAVNATGGWATEVVDGGTDMVGSLNSIAIDSNGYVHISYQDSGNDYLKYASNVAGEWTTESVSSIGSRAYWHGEWDTSIAVDSAGGVHIGYYDVTNSDLAYASFE